MQKLQRRKVCRYYARGKCVKEDCPFVHQTETKKPCKFWVQSGYCRKGKNCQFYHATKQQKNKHEGEQKIDRNFIVQKKGLQIDNKKKQLMDNANNQPVDTAKQSQQTQPPLDAQTNLQLKQQLLKQLQSPQNSKLQFFKQYPKSFPDHSKTLQSKQHIKKVEQRYFQQKSFLQLLRETESKEQQEYYQIVRRYQDSFNEVQQEGNKGKVYVVRVRPLLYNKQMTMHFVFQQNYLQLKVDQSNYPQQRATFQILNPSIPSAYKTKLLQIISKYHATHTIFDTLKFLQNNFEKNYQTAKFRLENQHFKKIELKQKIQIEKEKIRQEEKKEDEKQEKKEGRKEKKEKGSQQEDNNRLEDDDRKHQKHQKPNKAFRQQRPPKQPKQPKQPTRDQPPNPILQKPKREFRDYFQLDFNHHQKPQHQNLNDEITVQSLIMHNCPYLVVEKLLLYIECNCSRVLMYLFDAEERKELKLWVKLKCKKCNDCVRIVWERAVIHNKGQLVSRMAVANGKLVDVGGVGWKVGCECDAEIIKPKLYLPGQKMQLNCHSCFANMNIQYNGIKNFNPFVKQFQLQDDKELPLKGACNHDKLNFRWMRYACCGRPFACDECHDINAVKQHEIFNGLTMICGYCAHQQNISDSCARCKKQLLKGQDKAGHWEGGLGCRDQQLLSKKDGKKYAGMGKVESNNKKKKQK